MLTLPNRHTFIFLLCVLTGWLSACTVGPDFKPPQVEMPEQWASPVPEDSETHQDLTHWWTIFNDETLNALIERAMSENLDLKLAVARISQARAARGQSAAERGPVVNASASYQRYKGQPNNGQGFVPQSTTDPVVDSQYQAGFDASWEIDLFGGTRRKIEASDAELEASIEAQRDTQVSLIAEVARVYMDLRILQRRLVIAKQHLQAQDRSVTITRKRFEGGFVSALDVANAQVQAAETAARIPLLESVTRQTIHKLGIILGGYPDLLFDELDPITEIPFTLPAVPVGIPSELLRRRPDIRRAEAEIHAATARIGMATADLYPKLSITASLSSLSNTLSSLFSSQSEIWSLGSGIGGSLFDSGRTRANIEIQKTLEQQALITYKQKVLTALLEVEDALIALTKEDEHWEALNLSVQSNRKSVRLANQLYVAGETDFLQVLLAEQSLFTKEDALAQSIGNKLKYLISLYKALGGGWESPEAD